MQKLKALLVSALILLAAGTPPAIADGPQIARVERSSGEVSVERGAARPPVSTCAAQPSWSKSTSVPRRGWPSQRQQGDIIRLLGPGGKAANVRDDRVDDAAGIVGRQCRQYRRQPLLSVQFTRAVGRFGNTIGIEQQHLAEIDVIVIDRKGKIVDDAERRSALGFETARPGAPLHQEGGVVTGTG